MKKVVKTKRILVDREKIPAMMKEHHCSENTVYTALRYVTNSKKACDIRYDALNKYGGIPISEHKIVRC